MPARFDILYGTPLLNSLTRFTTLMPRSAVPPVVFQDLSLPLASRSTEPSVKAATAASMRGM